jgi:type II restriction/modification system DNA methylase subunit YeeA
MNGSLAVAQNSGALKPVEFVRKWQAVELKERSAAQEHFIDLCRMLGEPTPAEADPKGTEYCFEKGAAKTTGGEGWADVWKRRHFGWEYKGKRKDLRAAFAQLQQYALALENPPLLVVCDMDRIEIHTNWTNSVSRSYQLALEDLLDADKRAILKAAMEEPERLKPDVSRSALTERAAGEFAKLAQRLRARGHEAHAVARFINRLVFCMFAEDVELLPNRMFSRMLEQALVSPDDFVELAGDLFASMHKGGRIGFERVDWFNGGLFDDATALPIEKADIQLCVEAAKLDWGSIDPSILGTLFERGLDPDKRAQLGAHYTDRDKIMLLVEPLISRPLLAEWAATKAKIEDALQRHEAGKTGSIKTKALHEANGLYRGYLDRLRAFRVLDPACGSGNFLYLALLTLKDIEHRIGLEVEALGLQREFPQIGPEAVLGIELNPFAAELARVTVWIGEIQWMRKNGFDVSRSPILKPLDTIQCRDALLNEDGTPTVWPRADVLIGNPPFLGGKRLRSALGNDYVNRLFAAYAGVVPAEADLVTYWVAKASATASSGAAVRAGFVTTNSIRQGANRAALHSISVDGLMFDAWSDEPWVVDGADVRVSLLCFGDPGNQPKRLNGEIVDRINADLTSLIDLTQTARLRENAGVAFMGDTKGGAFDVPGEQAREWLQLPLNPNGRPNHDVLRPWMNGMDVVRWPSDTWIIDFGWSMSESEASLYEAPFAHVLKNVQPVRALNNREMYARYWWRHVEPRPGMWAALQGLPRYLVTPEVSKHRIFAWLPAPVVPDHKLQVFARDDNTFFGVLQSRFHAAWAKGVGSWHGVGNDPRYTVGTCFGTFPFPAGLTPNIPAADYAADPRAVAIAEAAKRLDELRQNWLKPGDLVTVVPEVVAGFPDRVLPKDDAAAKLLAKRTLTNLYNERPTWLQKAHADLDAAVTAAYGWPADIATEDALQRLLELNAIRVE